MAKTKEGRSARDVKEEKERKKQALGDDAGPSTSKRASTSKQAMQIGPADKEYIDRKVSHYQEHIVASAKLTEQDLKECVTDVMRHMLAANNKKPGQPVKHSAILDVLKGLQAKKVGIAGAVVSKAQACFTTFGMEMAVLDIGATKGYVLRSLLPRKFIVDYIHSDEDKALDGLKACILTFLHLSGDKCTEDQLWEHLSLLGFYQMQEPHPAFGAPPEKVIERLIEQRYLSFTIRSDGPESVRMYARGEALTGDYAEVDGEGIKAHLLSMVERPKVE